MCFSAPVSFSTSATLAVIGIMTLRKTAYNKEIPLGLLPLLFAIQQFIEGILWLTLPQGEQYWLTQTYAFFVGIVWPILVPLAIFIIEPISIRKRLILPVIITGIMVGIYTLTIIINIGVSATIKESCLIYQYDGDDKSYILIAYVIATCAAFFISSQRRLNFIGALNISGFIAAYYFYRLSYASVWCFFAAVVSGLIYLYFRKNIENPLAKAQVCA